MTSTLKGPVLGFTYPARKSPGPGTSPLFETNAQRDAARAGGYLALPPAWDLPVPPSFNRPESAPSPGNPAGTGAGQ